MWSYCYLEHARKAPSFYPAEFDVAATAILTELNITHQDITVDTAKSIYGVITAIAKMIKVIKDSTNQIILTQI